jgi:hypothetical protein
LAVPWADDSIPADSVPYDWAQAGYSVGLTADGWAPADYSAMAGRGGRLYFLDARPGYSPMAERRLGSVEDCKDSLPLWPV